MYRLEKDFSFEASHRLEDHDGKCKRLHGHSWKGTVVVEGNELISGGPKNGMLLDYGDISYALQTFVVSRLDHYHLNDVLGRSPTSERVAEWVFEQLKLSVPGLTAIIIQETCTCRCEYRPGGTHGNENT